MTDAELVALSVEAKKAADTLNRVTRQLAFEGARVEIRTIQLQEVGWAHGLELVDVEVWRRVK